MRRLKVAYCRNDGENATSLLRYFMPSYIMAMYGAIEYTMHPFVDFGKGYTSILDKDIREADVVSFGQIVYKADIEAARALKKLGKKIIYDCDDLYFEHPDYYHIKLGKEALDSTREIMLLADIVTVCSPYLGQCLNRIVGVPIEKIIYIPNMPLCSDWNKQYKRYQELRDDKRKNGVVRIGIMGAPNHFHDWLENIQIFKDLKNKYHDKIKFEVLGFSEKVYNITMVRNDIEDVLKKEAQELYKEFKALDFSMWDYQLKLEEFPKTMCRLGWDIGVATLVNNDVDKSKSFLKYMDYSLGGICGVYQKQSPYTDVVVSGENGLMARDQKSFVSAISLLVEDKELRQKMVENAREDILENYDIQRNWNKWYQALCEAVKCS